MSLSKPVLYLCDHRYTCANSLFCELNGGECKHTVQKEHSRNHIEFGPNDDISKDPRFEKTPAQLEEFEGFFPFWVEYAYFEKDSQEKQLPL